VVDALHGPEPWERSGWHVMVDVMDAPRDDRRLALEWVLNALLYFDVELGLADEPLYLRRYRKPKEWESRPIQKHAADREPDTITPSTCPKCDAPMVEKENARTGRPFWSCSRYPDCRGSRNWQSPRRSTV
jgi:Topoisomerase DNA binding C4 zinc finger